MDFQELLSNPITAVIIAVVAVVVLFAVLRRVARFVKAILGLAFLVALGVGGYWLLTGGNLPLS